MELFQDKNINDIEWSVILPDTSSSTAGSDERASFSTASILRCAKVSKHSSYLIRNPKLLSNLETILSETSSAPMSDATRATVKTHSCLKHIIAANRAALGLDATVPLRPFMPPSRFNGAFAHEVTQFILDGHT